MALRGGILALDLATTTGFAIASPEYIRSWSPGLVIPEGQRTKYGLTCGTVTMAQFGSDRPAKLAFFHQWLTNQITVFGIRMIVYEAPLVRNQKTARLTFGLSAIAEACASRVNARIDEAHVSDVKIQATGKGRAEKPEMVAAANARGWDVIDHNIADALWLLDLACDVITKGGTLYRDAG
ncbi:MAG: hypothetical protein AXW12_00590 [Thalassospira sp. Nap_22]|nr:MAG: hypothetical protein AXW12_00590 [Thalassospira sp. Nap_22]